MINEKDLKIGTIIKLKQFNSDKEFIYWKIINIITLNTGILAYTCVHNEDGKNVPPFNEDSFSYQTYIYYFHHLYPNEITTEIYLKPNQETEVYSRLKKIME